MGKCETKKKNKERSANLRTISNEETFLKIFHTSYVLRVMYRRPIDSRRNRPLLRRG